MKKTATYICIAVLIGVLSPLHLLATNLDNCGGGASPATNIESNGIELTGTQCGELNVNVGTITADIKLYGSSQLTINGDINRIQGSILLENNTTLIINGNINRIESDLVIKQGTVYINGSVTADGKMELSLGGDAIFDGGTFISSGSDIIIKSGSVLDMRNSSEIRVPGSQTITNDGTILTDGSGNTINGTVEGTGTNPAYITYCVGSPCVEAPGFVLIETGGSTEVDEGGATDAFDILLFYKPTGNVTFTLTSSDPTEFTTSATTVTFTPANFDVAQTITVNPVDDAINDNDIVSTMTAAINTLLTSTEYDAVADKTLSVTTIDDEFLPPVATSFTESTSEDVEVFTSLTDLSYSDPDNEPLVSLRIVATPAKGTLFRDTPPYGSFDGTDVVLSNGNTLTNAQLSSSRLGYIPAANEFGTGYASMTYDVYDGREYSTSTYTINFDVASVNDAPAFTTSGNITVNEDFASQQVVSITPDPVPTDETGQTVTYSLAPTSVTFATIGFNTTTGQITFDAIADEFGSQTFTITANDAQTANNTATQNVTFTVNPINDAPSFTAGTNVQVNEDAGATNIAGWASAISKGPANESADILTFNVSNDNPSLFAIAPAVNTSTGDLTFTPVADAFGTATVDIQLRDNGGTISGGVDSTATVSISLGIVSINDAPTFSIADYLVVAINDGAKTVPGFASALSVGNAYEAGQTLTFSVSNNNNVLFATQPSIDPVSGDLSFTTAVDEIGTAQVSVQLQDDGGTANGGTNLSTIQTFDLVVTNPPTLTSVAAGKPEGNEDSEILISFSNLLSDSDAQDLDGTVDAFIVKALAGGTLKIGATSATAAPFSAGINDTISATNNAYWTPETDAFGDPLDAFTVVAMDDKGMTSDMGQSATPAQMVSPKVNAVNDAPSFTKGADQAVGDTHGAQTVNNWATAILAGPINESDQTSSLTFETSNNNNLIFDQQPMLDQAGTLTYAPKAGQSGVATVTVRLNDGGGTSFGGQEYSADQTFTITVEQPPVLTGFTSVVRTTNEDTQSANIRADNHLLPNSDASDPGDITWVNAPVFRVTEVVSGSLIIDGAPFAVGTNDIIRETPRKRAKWTPAADVFGDSVAAFKVVAVAQSGVTSQPPVTAYVQVTSVNDAPEITSFTSPLTSTLTDTEIEITFAEMLAASDASDVDGTVDAFEATLINSGSLKIGSSAGTATTATTFNKTIDNTNNAYWTPATSASGNLPAFTVKAQDDLGVLSTASAVVNVLVGGSPGMTVSAISNNISETGRTATFDVVLDAPPASAVVLDIASTNTAEGTITPTTLTFDNSNWNVSQQVTVTGVDDGVTDADQSLAINVSVNAALSNDAFDTVSAEAVSVTNINAIINSTSNADTVSWTNGSIWQDGLAPAPDHAVIGSDILIGGYVRVYQDSLTSLSNELVFAQNGAEYTLTVDSGAILVVENSLIFQQSATNLVVKEGGRLVVLGNFINDPFHSVVNDGVIAIAENYYQADASVNYSGTGNLYVGGSVTTVGSDADLVDQPIGNLQDGAAHEDAHVYELLMTHLHELLVTETNDSTYVSEIGLVDTLRVQLSAQPASDVVLDLLAADTSETQITPATLTFTNANWNVDQIVRVEGKNDPEIDGNVVSLLTVSVNTTASDSSYQFTAPKSIAVTNEDDDTLPVAIDNAQLVDEDSLLILSKTDFTFSDADGDTLVKVKIVSLPVEGLLFRDVAPKNGQYDTGEEVLGNDEILVQEIIAGQLIYQTPANTFGSPADSLVFQVQDEFYFSNSAKLVININGVNDAPSFTKGADQVVNEDTTAITVSNWATSISAGPGETEAVTFDVSNDSSALFSVQPAIASNGTLTYTPAANAYGSATVSVILNDGQAANNLSTTETFTITINAINDAPSYTKGADQVVNEDTTAITITNWATSISAGPGESEAVTFDVSNDSSALFSSQPSIAANGTLTFTPAANAYGSATVSVILNDGQAANNLSTTETFTITINAVNDAPSFTKGADQVVNEDTSAITITNWATSISAGPGETEAVTFDVSNDSSAIFSIQPAIAANGTLTYTPAANAYGSATVSVTLNDGQASNNLSATKTFTITINAVNDVPSFTKGADQVVNEDTTAITISNWATSISAGPGESEAVTFDVSNDSSALFSSQPSIAANGTLTFTPAANAYGSATVSVILNDGQAANNLSTTETFTITINAVNDAPSFTKGADQVIDEDAGAQTILNWATAISAGEGESQSLTFEVSNDSAALFSGQPAIDANGTLTYTPAANAYGSATVSVTLNDGQASNNLSATETFTITINGVNDAPSYTKGADQVVNEDTTAITVSNWATSISAGPGETEAVTFDVSNDSSALFSVQPSIAANGTLTYTPAANAYGSATVSVTLNDGQAANNLSATETFTIAINAVNDAPSFTKGADQSIDEDAGAQSIANWATAISAGPGETETVTFDVTNDSSALFSVQPSIAANGTLTYTPAANAYGSATVSVTLNDGQSSNNLSSTETFTITINSVNDAPSFSKGADQVVNEDTSAITVGNWATSISAGPGETEVVTFDVSNDSSALFSVQPSIASNGTLTYTPAANAYGSATVSVTLNDGQTSNNLSATEIFTITINAINDAPSFTKGADQVVNEDTTAITVSNWATSISAGPGETETVTFDVTNDSSALFSVQPSIATNGTLTYTPAANAYGSATVSVTLNDGQAANNLSTTETFTITINAVNDAPSFTKGADQVIDEDAGEQSIANWASAISAGPGETESVTFDVNNDSSALFSVQPSISANGTLTFTPAANAYGSATVSVTLNDGQASNNLSSTETFTITINAVNDAPSFTKGADEVVNEDTTAITITNWATAISAGPGETETVTFDVTNDSSALFSAQPEIAANGTLTFTPAANAYGSATVSVTLNDGQASNNLSSTETFTITINAVNDAPSFTKGADQVIDEDPGAQTILNWATAISAGPGETESVTFDVNNDSSALFSVQPSISANGTLTFTPAANAYGSATVSVTLNDGQATNNLSTTETFTITINAVNDAPSFTKGADQVIDEDAGAQSITNWATAISAGSGETESVSFNVTNDSSALFSVQPSIAANGTLTYTPAVNAYGLATVSVSLNDGQATNNLSSTETFTITINAVNDAPSFTKGADQVIDEDAGAQTILNWATAISAGPSETESVSFDVTNDSSALFSVQPSIAANGTLTFTPEANTYGSATVSVTLNDGQASNNLSSTETFTITINAVNDAPSFTKGADQVIDEDAGAQTILNWATAISAGPGETESVTFDVNNDSSALFSVQPSIASNGTLTFTPAANAYGSATVSVTLNDGQASNNLSSTETFTITINAVNDAPSFTKGADQVIDEDAGAQTILNWATAISAGSGETESVSFNVTNDSSALFSVQPAIASNGTLTYTPAANAYGSATVSVTLNDGQAANNLSTTETFTITINAINDAPSFTKGADQVVNEDTTAITVSNWPTVISAGPGETEVVIFDVTNDSSALFSVQPSIAANGTLTYTPAANAYGSATVSVTLNDGQATNNLSSTETFTITINGVNDAPSFTKGGDQSIDEDAGAQIILNWATAISAGPSETESVSFDVTNDSSALFSVQPSISANGTLTYTPAANAYGSATVSVTLNDGQATNNLSSTETFTITINGVNDAPSFTKGADQVVNEDTTAITITNWAKSISAGPGETEVVTFDVTNDSSALFSVQPSIDANGTLTYTPAANAYGSATVSVTLNDGQATNNLSTTETFTITINAINDAPSFSKGADQVIDEDAGAQTILNWATAISAGEGELQSLTFEVSNDSATLFSGQPAIDANGALMFTPAANAYGSATVSVTLNDGQASNNLSATETFTITINAVNDVPSFTKGTDQVIDEDAGAQTILNWATAISAGEGESQSLTFEVSNDSAALFSGQPAIDANGALMFTPAANAYGSATVSVILNDGQAANNLSTTETFTITINAVNDAPSFTKGADQVVNEDTTAISVSNWATAISAGPGETESVSFDVTNDSSALFSVQPSINSNGTLTYTPSANAYGSATVSVTLNDGQAANNLSTTETFTITINAVNDVPSFTKGADQEIDEDAGAQSIANWATSISAGPGETEAVTFDVSNDSSALFSIQPAIAANGTLTYTPAANAYGSATVSVTLNDGQATNNLSSTETFTITINGVNDAPSFSKGTDQVIDEDAGAQTVSNWATAISAGPGETEAVTFDVSNDSSALFSVQPAIASNGTLTYTPAANAYGSATVSVTLNDGQATNNLSSTETFTITINAINDAPSFTKGADQVIDEDAGAQTILNWATAISAGEGESQSLTFEVSNDSAALFSGQPAIDANGALMFTPAANAYGSATVSVTLNDGQAANNLSTTETFTITINAVNDAPVITSINAVETLEDISFFFKIDDLKIEDADSELSEMSVRVLSGANYTAQGATLTPDSNFFGELEIELVVNDGTSDSEPFKASLQVIAVNDAPTFTAGADINIEENTGNQSVRAWATSVSWGAVNEAGQVLTFELSVDKPELFDELPAINSAGDLSFKTKSQAFGVAAVDVQLFDDGGTTNGGKDASTISTFKISISEVNDAPVITDQKAKSAQAGETVTISLEELIVEDPDNAYPTDFSLAIYPGEHYIVTEQSIRIAAEYAGNLPVEVSVNDGELESNIYEFLIAVSAQDDPIITGQRAIAFDEDTSYEITLDDLTIENARAEMQLSFASGELYTLDENILTPKANYNGPLNVAITLIWSGGETTPFELQMEVLPVNDQPVANDDVFEVFFGEELQANVLANDTDIDGDELTVEAETISNGRTILALNADGSIVFSSSDQAGAFNHYYKTCDAGGLCTEGLLTVNVIYGDFDDDQIPDEVEIGTFDTDEDGIPDFQDTDADNDGIPDAIEAGVDPVNPVDTDADGTPDYLDLDSDADGKSDLEEGIEDCDADGIPNYLDANEACEQIVAAEGFSPNGDGINDLWELAGIEDYPNNKVQIYNRWGTLVKEFTNYNNTSNAWAGLNRFSKEVPDGTYFYIVTIQGENNPAGIQLNGYIIVSR